MLASRVGIELDLIRNYERTDLHFEVVDCLPPSLVSLQSTTLRPSTDEEHIREITKHAKARETSDRTKPFQNEQRSLPLHQFAWRTRLPLHGSFVSESITGWEVTTLAPFLAGVLVLPVILPRPTPSFPKVMIDVTEIVMAALFMLTLRILGPDLAHIRLKVFVWLISVLVVECQRFFTELAVLQVTAFVSLLQL